MCKPYRGLPQQESIQNFSAVADTDLQNMEELMVLGGHEGAIKWYTLDDLRFAR
jgi:hypothetical protein